MSEKSSCDRVATTAGRAHRAYEIDVDERLEFADCFAVVPALEVHPLTNELDRRLRSELDTYIRKETTFSILNYYAIFSYYYL